MFSIRIEAERKLVRVAMSGFLTAGEVAEFSRQEQAAARAMGCGTKEFLLLVDTSGCIIQSQEVVAAFQDIVAHSPLKARRIAVVRGGSLTRMQTRRIIADRSDALLFEALDEAEAWLFSEEQAQSRERLPSVPRLARKP